MSIELSYINISSGNYILDVTKAKRGLICQLFLAAAFAPSSLLHP